MLQNIIFACGKVGFAYIMISMFTHDLFASKFTTTYSHTHIYIVIQIMLQVFYDVVIKICIVAIYVGYETQLISVN